MPKVPNLRNSQTQLAGPALGIVRVWTLTVSDGACLTVEEWPDGVLWGFYPDGGASTSANWECIESWDTFVERAYIDMRAPAAVRCSSPARILGIGEAQPVLLDKPLGGGASPESRFAIKLTTLNGEVYLLKLWGEMYWPYKKEFQPDDPKTSMPGFSHPVEVPWHVWRMVKSLTWSSIVFGETKTKPLGPLSIGTLFQPSAEEIILQEVADMVDTAASTAKILAESLIATGPHHHYKVVDKLGCLLLDAQLLLERLTD